MTEDKFYKPEKLYTEDVLEKVKTEKIKDYDREDKNLQSIAKELHGIYKELNNLNRILSRRK